MLFSVELAKKGQNRKNEIPLRRPIGARSVDFYNLREEI